jgi:hypothetical protein
MKRLRGKLTYANVMATIAVFIALGGASYAAVKLPKNSVGAKQLKKNAVTPAKLSRQSRTALTGPKGALGERGPQGPQGLQGERGPGGDPGAYATVAAGSPSQFLGTHPGFIATERKAEGDYCLTPAPGISTIHAMATIEWNTSIGNNILVEPVGSGEKLQCAEGQLDVRTFILIEGGAAIATNHASFTVFIPEG